MVFKHSTKIVIHHNVCIVFHKVIGQKIMDQINFNDYVVWDGVLSLFLKHGL